MIMSKMVDCFSAGFFLFLLVGLFVGILAKQLHIHIRNDVTFSKTFSFDNKLDACTK